MYCIHGIIEPSRGNGTPTDSDSLLVERGGDRMKGYPVQAGYMGYVPFLDRWMLFATESDYQEYLAG